VPLTTDATDFTDKGQNGTTGLRDRGTHTGGLLFSLFPLPSPVFPLPSSSVSSVSSVEKGGERSVNAT